jgi:hypothetical protein
LKGSLESTRISLTVSLQGGKFSLASTGSIVYKMNRYSD